MMISPYYGMRLIAAERIKPGENCDIVNGNRLIRHLGFKPRYRLVGGPDTIFPGDICLVSRWGNIFREKNVDPLSGLGRERMRLDGLDHFIACLKAVDDIYSPKAINRDLELINRAQYEEDRQYGSGYDSQDLSRQVGYW